MSVDRVSIVGMWPIIGSEAIGSGVLTRGQLRWRYTALFPDVYVPNGTHPDRFIMAEGAWLWTGRTGTIAGTTAASLHSLGSGYSGPVQLIAERRRTPPGVLIRQEHLDDDEVHRLGELPLTSPARTAFDVARQLPRDEAVVSLDRLAAATGVTKAQIAELFDRYRGARGIEQARAVAHLMDAGAASREQSLLRVMLIDAGLPRPQTNITVGDDFAATIVTLGWPEKKVGIGFADKRADQFAIRAQLSHQDVLQTNGWIEVRVGDDYWLPSTIGRVQRALRLQRIPRYRA